jgi:hypothetical protein
MPQAKAMITRATEVPLDGDLRVSVEICLFTDTGRIGVYNIDIPFSYSTSQVELRNAVRAGISAEAAKLGYSVSTNQILTPCDA